jgi:hypothetical protein
VEQRGTGGGKRHNVFSAVSAEREEGPVARWLPVLRSTTQEESAPSAQPSDAERTREVWWWVGAREDKDGRRLSRDRPGQT